MCPISTHPPPQGLKEIKALMQLIGSCSFLISTPRRGELAGSAEAMEVAPGPLHGAAVVLGQAENIQLSCQAISPWAWLPSRLELPRLELCRQLPMAEDGGLRGGKSQSGHAWLWLDGLWAPVCLCCLMWLETLWSKEFEAPVERF